MSTLHRLPIRAANGSPMVHKFYTHGPGAKCLSMFMPGGNYWPDAPMLYYPRELLAECTVGRLPQYGRRQGCSWRK